MNIKAFIQRHSVSTYFGIAFLLSYGSFLVMVGPKLLRGGTIQPTDVLLLFPFSVIGVGLTGIALTGIVDGRSGLRDLFSRMGRWRVGIQWYAAALLIPPALFVAVLLVLSTLVSRNFTPHFSPISILFGLVAGFFEEIGWMGYAFPKMQVNLKQNALSASIFLGVLWGLWHAPVVDYFGAAAPHGMYWLPFFLAFIILSVAVRVLIAWAYSNTRSVLLAQLLHASYAGFLAVLAPAHISPAQETFSYTLYAVVLWIVVAIVVARYGKSLVRQPMQIPTI